jgi:hypothetical protein
MQKRQVMASGIGGGLATLVDVGALVLQTRHGTPVPVAAFISACLDELANAVLHTPGTAPAPATLAAVRAMTLDARLGFYRLTEDARVQYVEALPAPIARPLIAILRGERDP